MKVMYHKFTGSLPIIFVENFKDFAGGILENMEQTSSMGSKSMEFCRFANFKGSPLKFIVFSEGMMRTLFGKKRNESMIEASLAIFEGSRKYPMNERLAMNHACKLAMRYERRETFEILASEYENKFNTQCPYSMVDMIDEAVADSGENSNKKSKADELIDQGYKNIPGYGSYWSKTGKPPAEKKIEKGVIKNVPPAEAKKHADKTGGQGQAQQPKAAPTPEPEKTQVVARDKETGEELSSDDVQARASGGDDQEQTGPVRRTPAGKQTAQALLRTKQMTDKDKSVDQKAAAAATESDYYTEEPELSDSEFEEKNEGYWLDEDYRMSLSNDITEGRMPRKEVALLERLMNTRRTGETSKITHFSPNAGAGEIRSQAGELCMQLFASMDPNEVEETADEIIAYLEENGDGACLTSEWVKAAANNARALREHLDLRYGEGSWEMMASAWDTEEGVEAMVGRNIHESGDKGYSTDVFFTIKTPDGNIEMLEVSLKKDLSVKLLNSGPREILRRVPELEGTNLDTSVFIRKEEDFLAKAASPENIGRSIELLKKAAKNLDQYSPKEQSRIKEALEAAKKISPKLDPKEISKNLIENPHGKSPGVKAGKKAAWLPMYVASEVLGDPQAKKIKDAAAKLYEDYQSEFFEEFKSNKNVREATMDIIRQELPLVSVLENEEIVIAGSHSIDRATMQEIFGVSDPKKFKESLDVYESPPPPFIGYAAAGSKGKPIPIAMVRMRAEALGYGARVKFDMDVHPQFRSRVEDSTRRVYGVK